MALIALDAHVLRIRMPLLAFTWPLLNAWFPLPRVVAPTKCWSTCVFNAPARYLHMIHCHLILLHYPFPFFLLHACWIFGWALMYGLRQIYLPLHRFRQHTPNCLTILIGLVPTWPMRPCCFCTLFSRTVPPGPFIHFYDFFLLFFFIYFISCFNILILLSWLWY